MLIKNANGKTLLFQGYIDPEITMRKMIKYINEGMYKLLNKGREKFVFKKINFVMKANNWDGIIYDLP